MGTFSYYSLGAKGKGQDEYQSYLFVLSRQEGMCGSKNAAEVHNSESDHAYDTLSSYLLLMAAQGSVCA